MSDPTLSRRTFVITSACAAVGIVGGIIAPNVQAATPELGEAEPLAKALQYVKNAPADKKQAKQICQTCALYQGKPKDKSGACQLFPGKLVAAQGWCKSFAAK